MSREKSGAVDGGSKASQQVALAPYVRRVRRDLCNRTCALPENSRVVVRLRGDPNPDVVRVLRAAVALLRKEGWFPHYLPESERFAAIQRGDSRASGITMITAIQEAGGAGIACHHARQELGRLVSGHLSEWEAHPLRLYSEVVGLMSRGMVLAGGESIRSGSWTVSSGPRKAGAA